MRSQQQRDVESDRPLLIAAVRPMQPSIHFTIDRSPAMGWAGQTVLAAMLLTRSRLNTNDANGEPRAGFCLMGACQDCWVWLADGSRIRACTTPLEDGMAILTKPPIGIEQNG